MAAIAFALIVPLGAWAACGDADRASAVYQAVEKCQMSSIPKEASLIQAASNAAGAPVAFCRAGTETGLSGAAIDPTLCSDPNAFVCKSSSGTGLMLTSKCKLELTNPAQAIQTPGAVSSRCEGSSNQAVFLAAHQKECAANSTPEDCDAQIRARHSSEFQKIERNAIYTPARIAKVTQLFDRVKAQYLALLESSKTIPSPTEKKYLRSLIANTTLALSPADLAAKADGACHNSTSNGVMSTGMYNGGNSDGLSRKMHICIGAMAALDNMDPYEMMWTIGHELSHSIDPCRLEVDAWDRLNKHKLPGPQRGAARVADTLYPELVNCLNGGTGLDGCTDAVLHCTTDKGRDEFCSEIASDGTSANLPKETWIKRHDDCSLETKYKPSCLWGKSDTQYDIYNASDYRGNPAVHPDIAFEGQPISQIGESFADFMGGQVLGKIMTEDSQPGAHLAPGPLDLAGKRDALLAVAAVHATLHGACLDHNTLDEHPPGYLRTNRMFMGSKSLRDALGCTQPVKPERGGTTCRGL